MSLLMEVIMATKGTRLYCTLILISSLLLTGCVPLLIGAGIVTGFLVTKDTVSGNFEVSYDKLWASALAAVEEKADIVDQDKEKGFIKAGSNQDEIIVKIKELTESSQNLRVTARKALALANLTLAQEVFTKIVRSLEHVNLK
ncbi:DUF3568 family protein [Candidatus Omnitrophota bacterium]